MHPFLLFSDRPRAHLPQGLCTYSSFCLKYPYDRPSHRWVSSGSPPLTIMLRGSLPAPCLLSCVISSRDLLDGLSLGYEVLTLSGVRAPPAQKVCWFCSLLHPLCLKQGLVLSRDGIQGFQKSDGPLIQNHHADGL